MKFTNLFTLLVASSALAYNIPMKRDEFQDEVQKIGQAYDAANFDQIANDLQNGKLPTDTLTGNQAADNSNDNCTTLMKEIEKCVPSNPEADVKGVCKMINNEECKAILKKDISSCNGIDLLLHSAYFSAKIGCAVDENGKYCPLAVAFQDNSSAVPNYDSLFEGTCKSKACTDSALESLTTLKNIVQNAGSDDVQEIAAMEKFLASLKEEKCTAAHSTATQDSAAQSTVTQGSAAQNNAAQSNAAQDSAAQSGASHVKVGSALLFTLAFFLSYF